MIEMPFFHNCEKPVKGLIPHPSIIICMYTGVKTPSVDTMKAVDIQFKKRKKRQKNNYMYMLIAVFSVLSRSQ